MKRAEKNYFTVHTDLAVEERERFPGEEKEIPGVVLRKWKEGRADITEVIVESEAGAEAMGKPKGRYITIEAPELAGKDQDFHKEVSEILAAKLRDLLKIEERSPEHMPAVLVAGLGNREATPDSLGPLVMDHLQVTRHLNWEYGADFCKEKGYPVISGIIPGVMAQTGMETAEILRGIIAQTYPDAVLVIDALAARRVHRLGTTIQLSDTGIYPGSGVGNHRNSLTEETLGIPVIAVGVPTVVGAAAIIHDAISTWMEILKQESEQKRNGVWVENVKEKEMYEQIREIMEPQFGPMYVTPHNIDERIQNLSFTISEAIHEAFYFSRRTSGEN